MLQNLGRLTLAGGLVVTLAACAGTQLDNSRDMTVQGGAFNAALYEGYIDRSEHEYNYGDYESSDLFAIRAQQSANGQTVMPLPLEGGPIAGEEGAAKMSDKMPAIADARDRLMSALNATARTKAPEAAATAQVAFDCWVEESQPDHIADCRSRFDKAIKTAENAVQTETKAAPEAPEPERQEPRTFTVYFGFDSAQLSQEARDVLNRVARAAENRPDAEISATGFTDTAGPADYNQDLSFRRAQAVERGLTNLGVADDRIGTAARGENQLAVETADGVREPQNRRVQISLF
jgi:outer membrane protein OmpA-like peptidoglycan-associated protein